MCKILGKDFQQYLPIVMGPVLKAASLKPEVALLDSKWIQYSTDKILTVSIGKFTVLLWSDEWSCY